MKYIAKHFDFLGLHRLLPTEFVIHFITNFLCWRGVGNWKCRETIQKFKDSTSKFDSILCKLHKKKMYVTILIFYIDRALRILNFLKLWEGGGYQEEE